MPRYVIASGDVYEMGRTPGVIGLVVDSEGPKAIPDGIVARWRAKGDENQLVDLTEEQAKERDRFIKGQKAILNCGLYTNSLGEIELDDGNSVRLWIRGFNGKVLATVEPEHLTAIT